MTTLKLKNPPRFIIALGVFLSIAGLVFTTPYIRPIDARIASWLQRYRTSQGIVAAQSISAIGNVSSIMGLTLLSALFLCFKKKGVIRFIGSIVSVYGIVRLIKLIFHRERPLTELLLLTDYSFPSGHATIAMVFFGALYKELSDIYPTKRTLLGRICVTLISAIGGSRMYLHVHRRSDVLAGWVLGWLICEIVYSSDSRKLGNKK